MRVFIGMESSGVSRRAFSALGHDVVSCDYLAQDDEPGVGRHIQGEVFDTLSSLVDDGWMPDFGLFHPTCTYLTWSAEWAYKEPDFERYPGVGYHQKLKEDTLFGACRRQARVDAIDTMKQITLLTIQRIVIENPKGAFDEFSPGYQTVQPYMFGDDASKATNLHLVRTKPLDIPQRAKWVQPRIVKRQTALGKPDRQRPEPAKSRRGSLEGAERHLSRLSSSVGHPVGRLTTCSGLTI